MSEKISIMGDVSVRRSRASLTIGEQTFPSKKVAIEYFQELFRRYNPGDMVIGRDHDDLLALTEKHPEADYMIGPGIDHFRIKLDEYGTGRTYKIHWVDGGETLISYRKCINGQTPHRTQVFNAFRPVIAPTIEQWRCDLFKKKADQTGRVPCEISGTPLLQREGEVDHTHPHTFSALVDQFLKIKKLTYHEVRLRENWDGHVHRPVEDDQLAEDFRVWHDMVAILRFIRKDLNRSFGDRPPRSDVKNYIA